MLMALGDTFHDSPLANALGQLNDMAGKPAVRQLLISRWAADFPVKV